MKRSVSSLVKSGLSLSALTFLSRILGLVREMIKSAFLGTGPLADAFTVAFMIPNLLRRIFAENTMTVAFIPTFRSPCGKRGNERISFGSFYAAVFRRRRSRCNRNTRQPLDYCAFLPKNRRFFRHRAADPHHVSVPAVHLNSRLFSGYPERRTDFSSDRCYTGFVQPLRYRRDVTAVSPMR